MELYIGADWDQKTVVFAAGKSGDTAQWKGEIKLSAQAIEAWKKQLHKRFPQTKTIYLAIERGLPIWQTLFQSVGCTVFAVDPARAKAFANAVCASAAKADSTDAYALFLIAQNPAVRRQPINEHDDENAALMRVSRRHERITRDLNRTSNRLRSRLAEAFAGLELPDLKRQWVGDFLTKVPTAWHYQALSRDERAELIEELGMRSKQRASLTVSVEQSLHALGSWEAEVVGDEIRDLVSDLKHLLAQRKVLEVQFDKLVALKSEQAAQLRSVDGIGAKLCGYLMALYFFSDAAPLSRDGASIRLGASPVTIQSGAKTRWGEQPARVSMRRSAPELGRRTVYLLGMQATRNLGWGKAQYRYLRAHGKTHGGALRCVARSLLRILSSMKRSGSHYDDARYVQALKSKGVVWAHAL